MFTNHGLRIVLGVCLFATTLSLPVVAEEGHSEAAHAAEHEGHAAPSLNFFDFSSETSHPLVALLFNFGALVLIVYLLMRKPLGKRFQKRKDDLVAALAEAEAAKKQAEETIAAAKAKMAAIDDEVAELKKEILTVGEKESAAIVARAEEQAERLVQETEKLVAHEITIMTETLRREIVEEIVNRAADEIQKKISSSDHEKILNEYLKQVADTGMHSNAKH